MARLFALCLSMMLTASMALAHTSAPFERTCPLCDTTFTTILDMSGTQFGMRLDLKPVGPIAAPWKVPVCTKCGFVMFDDELSEEQLAKCKTIVDSPEYQKHRDRASYYQMGRLYEQLERDDLPTAHIFLKASWQEEDDADHLKETLELSLKHFEAYLKQGPPKPSEEEDAAEENEATEETDATEETTNEEEQEDESSAYDTARLLKGELLRRLARFDDAKQHFEALLKDEPFQGNFLEELIRYQITLCDAKDAEPHNLSDMPSDEGEEVE